MRTEIIVAILSLIGTAVGSLAGIMTANKLVMYRLEQLEKRVAAHNNLIDRMYGAEKDIALVKDDLKATNNRIDELKKQGD